MGDKEVAYNFPLKTPFKKNKILLVFQKVYKVSQKLSLT